MKYTAEIRRSSGDTYTTTVETDGGASRADEIASEIAAAEGGELVSVTADDTEETSAEADSSSGSDDGAGDAGDAASE